MPIGNAYPFGQLVPSPVWGTRLCSNFLSQFSRTCRVFSRVFTLNTPRYLLDCALFNVLTNTAFIEVIIGCCINALDICNFVILEAFIEF